MAIKWGYLQVLAQLGLPACLILAAVAGRHNGWRQPVLLALAGLIWTAAALRGLHAGGRIDFGGILVTPFLAWMFVTRSRTAFFTLFAGLLAVVAVVAILNPTFFSRPHDLIGGELNRLKAETVDSLFFVLAYLGFPHIAAAHTLTVVPEVIDFRYFIDIPLGLAYMLPNFTGVETLPPMILSLHVKLLPWIPVDLFSFGYYSLGTLGVLIVFAAFGGVLALFDGWLTRSAGWLGQALRAAWLFYLPFRLLYADPYAALQSGFGLIAGTALVLALALWSRRRAA